MSNPLPNWPTVTSDLRTRLVGYISHRFRIDTRALAVFRMALGLLVLADLALRSRSLGAFYTDFGVLPRSALLSQANPLHWSIHLASGDIWIQALLFLIAGVFAVALTIGYRTSIATVGTWLLLVSIHNRMGDVLNGGDFLLRLLLFWAIFLPLGARWAIDSYHAADEDTRKHVTSVASAALLAQVVLVYATNAAFKLSGNVWLDGDGLEYVFSLGQFTVFFGDYLAAYPALLQALSHVWLLLIILSFLLIVLPGIWRTGFVALFVLAHIGMALTMRLDLFPLISIASLVPFVPAVFWDRTVSWFTRFKSVETGRRWIAAGAGFVPDGTVSDVPSALSRVKAGLTTLIPVCFLVLVVLWNVQFLGYSEVAGHDVVPEQAEPVIDITRTDQYWNMFAPNPLSTDGWIVTPGLLENGTRIDVFHGGTVRWDRPPDISETYPTARWRKYLVGLWRDDTADRRYFADYLCRDWNSGHDTALENVSVFFMEQPTRIDGHREPITRVQLAAVQCTR